MIMFLSVYCLTKITVRSDNSFSLRSSSLIINVTLLTGRELPDGEQVACGLPAFGIVFIQKSRIHKGKIEPWVVKDLSEPIISLYFIVACWFLDMLHHSWKISREERVGYLPWCFHSHKLSAQLMYRRHIYPKSTAKSPPRLTAALDCSC